MDLICWGNVSNSNNLLVYVLIKSLYLNWYVAIYKKNVAIFVAQMYIEVYQDPLICTLIYCIVHG